MPPRKPTPQKTNSSTPVDHGEKSPSLPVEILSQYLLAEFDGLLQRALHYEQALANKINFYLLVVTALAGGILLSLQSNILYANIVQILLLVSLFLHAMGWVTLSQGLELNYITIAMLRRAGRVRKWFAERDPSIVPYSPFNPADDHPLFYANYAPLRNTESILLLTNATMAGIFFTALCIFLQPLIINISLGSLWIVYDVAMAVGLVSTLLLWKLETMYIQNFMKLKDQHEVSGGAVHFPLKNIQNNHK